MENKTFKDVKSVGNIRDFSKYINKDGMRIKPGRIVRSSVIYNMSDEDYNKLFMSENPIRTVIDLRNPIELEKVPANISVRNNNINYYNFCLSEVDFFKEIGLYYGMDEFINRYNLNEFSNLTEEIYRQYIKSEYSRNVLKDIFKAIVDNSGDGILFHCVSGKDRTGIVSAILMYALDFSEADILEDYLLTNQYRLEKNRQKIMSCEEMNKSTEYIKKLVRFSVVSKSNMNAVFDEIKNLYNSKSDYLNDMGLTEENIAILKENLLENSQLFYMDREKQEK